MCTVAACHEGVMHDNFWHDVCTVSLTEVTWGGDRWVQHHLSPGPVLSLWRTGPITGSTGCWSPAPPVGLLSGCLTHSCSLRRGGARALTPTPPSVTCASRVRLFPRYVRRVFCPPLHWLPELTEDKQAQHSREERTGAGGGCIVGTGPVSRFEPADGRRGLPPLSCHQWSPNLPSATLLWLLPL